jgi:DNA-binding NarL/FixJ family response regulator
MGGRVDGWTVMDKHPIAAVPVRIALVALSGLLRDLIQGILAGHEDMAVLGEVPDCTTLRTLLADSGADVVVYGLDKDDLLDVCPDLFDEHPRIKVLTVRDDGRRGFLWKLQPRADALGEISPELLIDTIRKAVRP